MTAVSTGAASATAAQASATQAADSAASAAAASGSGAAASASQTPSSTISPAAAAANSPSGTSAADSTTSSAAAFQLPGTKLSVLPIGLGVFAGISVIALIVVGLVTYERTKYRRVRRLGLHMFYILCVINSICLCASFRPSASVSLQSKEREWVMVAWRKYPTSRVPSNSTLTFITLISEYEQTTDKSPKLVT